MQALEPDLVGPTPTVLNQLETAGESAQAAELRGELLDRSPNRWYQTAFLIPSETSLGDRADDAADDEFTGLDGQNLSAKRKSNASADDTGASEAGPARRVFFTCSVGLSLLVPTATGLEVTVHWASYKPTTPARSCKTPSRRGNWPPRGGLSTQCSKAKCCGTAQSLCGAWLLIRECSPSVQMHCNTLLAPCSGG